MLLLLTVYVLMLESKERWVYFTITRARNLEFGLNLHGSGNLVLYAEFVHSQDAAFYFVGCVSLANRSWRIKKALKSECILLLYRQTLAFSSNCDL